MKRHAHNASPEIVRALEKVERAAVDVTNEIVIWVDQKEWTAKQRALMRVIDRYETLKYARRK